MTELAKEKKMVPELRFSDFEGGWTLKTMNELTKINQGLQIAIANRLKVPKDGAHFYITNEFLREGNQKKYYIENPPESVLCDENDILMTRTGNTGQVVTGVKGAFHNNFFLIKFDHNQLDKMYLYYFLTMRKTQILLLKLAGTSTIPDLNHSDFYTIKIAIPDLIDEQKKIASFLTSVDEKLNLLRRKRDSLQTYKRGVMQKIFTQEIRFTKDDGSAFDDWEEKKLGDLTIKCGKKNKENVPYPIYSINNKEGFLPQTDQFEGIDSNGRGYDISMYKIIEKQTFAYNPARINVGSIGYSGELENIIISSLYVCFKTTEGLNDQYLLKYLDSYEFNKAVLRNVEGGVREYLFYENFSNIKITLPSIQEQRKVTDFLDSIDQKIDQVNQQITQTDTFKKGLLQKMFV